MKKVSVIVPVYNTSYYLEQCLKSIQQQTLKEIEIICVNDGSTDQSLEIINRFAKGDDRFVVIDKPNSGYGNTMNIGIQKASGKYIGIVESDDYILPDMFQYLYENAEKNDAEISKSNYFEKNDALGEEPVLREVLGGCPYEKNFSPIKEQEIFYRPLCIWSAIYERTFLLENNIWFNETPGASFQDASFNFQTLACAQKVYLTEKAYLIYRTDNAFSSVNNAEKVFCICDEYEKIERFIYERKQDTELLKKIEVFLKVNSYIWNYYRLSSAFQYAFLLRMHDEFVKEDKKGILNLDEWKDDERQRDILDIISVPREFFYRTGKDFADERVSHLMEEKDMFFYRKGCIMFLRESGGFWLYGAGKLTSIMIRNLEEDSLKGCIKGIVVTEKENNPDFLEGFPVFSLEELTNNKEVGDEDLFFITMAEKYHYDVIKLLERNGFANLLILQGHVRDALLNGLGKI